ncbi:nucleoside triphosphate pyrophosphohydrolase [Plesiomonas shigelloides]|uniref:Nucleoside triphosphate pyrophosphohydrolase n=1 Tax=Plesiomonas shigelloides 302-73 TaxID=1315976 RepID=R8AMZ1_PLESH|nr:nucleoside triphosphate pyrophosphohydrolase [Plesiomonas shigelloides]EON87709.1 nucleoside triphosphate pyrophosphohydrolase [Plesiomonas shigelloides 302-73]
MSSSDSLSRLLSIMQRLRDPQAGCPWDKQQTFASIAPYTLEETYEVIDAIAREDYTELKSELGDLLYQVVFYAQMASEQGLFDFHDICAAISDKLERRHPHVFACQDHQAQENHYSETVVPEESLTTEAIAPETVSERWETIKQQERAAKAQTSVLDDIPKAQPALMRAYKMQKRCATVGFDWDTLGPVVEKVHEEIDEVLAEACQVTKNEVKLAEEIGDLLFATVNLSRHLGHRPELALQQACDKFERRFRQIEQAVAARGALMSETSLEEMEALWQEIKRREPS